MPHHPVIVWIFSYLYKALVNWFGILLLLDGAVALSERYLGDFVEQRFNKKIHVPTKLKWGFAIAVFIVAQGVAYRDLESEVDQAGSLNTELVQLNGKCKTAIDGLERENKTLRDLVMAKDRPIIVQAAPDLAAQKLLQRQDEELRKLKDSTPSLRRRALQLSNDMLNFSAEVIRDMPQSPFLSRAKNNEDFKAQWDQFSIQTSKFLDGKAAEYQRQFSVRIVSLQEDLKTIGINGNIDGCQYSNGNTFGMQRCGTAIGVLAEKIPR